MYQIIFIKQKIYSFCLEKPLPCIVTSASKRGYLLRNNKVSFFSSSKLLTLQEGASSLLC